MTSVYTKVALLDKVDEWLTPEKISKLYAQDFVNYTGITADTKEPYTEVIAKRLLSNLAALEKIERIGRESPYKTAGHEWKPIDKESPRSEEQIARSMMGHTCNFIGKIIDYQMPLKNVQSDDAGKIDLLSWNEEEGRAYILEFKVQKSQETLLRCILEIDTYSRTVNSEKLLRDFGCSGSDLRKAVLVYEGSRPYTDFDDTNIKKLMNALRVDLFVLDKDNTVAEPHYFEKLEG